RPTEAVLGDHPGDRLLHSALGARGEELGVVDALEATRVVRVTVGALLLQLGAGQSDLVRVDDDDKVTGVDVGCESRLVLAAEQTRGLRCEPTQNNISGVDDVPLALDVAGLRGVRTQCCLLTFVSNGWTRAHPQPRVVSPGSRTGLSCARYASDTETHLKPATRLEV